MESAEESADELFDLVDEHNLIVGTAPRSEVHGNPSLRHRAVHVLIFDHEGRVLLQLRNRSKLIQPGKWDTSVGGHVLSGESYLAAASREAEEELGVGDLTFKHLFDFVIANEIETEHVRLYKAIYDGPIEFDQSEISDVRYFDAGEVSALIAKGVCTPSLAGEHGVLTGAISSIDLESHSY